ncbi:hypothetical protein C8Q72DRAFT_883201 [Fomitopsis betulina]|nr:hypothetical protein C8Q72DRAFT_883201 [Fomitopsis betulina]
MFVPTLFYVALAAASAVPALGMYTDAAGVLRRGDIHDRLLALERRTEPGNNGSHPPKKAKIYTHPHPMMRSDEASSSLWDRESDDVLYARDYAPLWSRSPIPVGQPHPFWPARPSYSWARPQAPKRNTNYPADLHHPQPVRPNPAWVSNHKVTREDDAGLWERRGEELWARMEVDRLD